MASVNVKSEREEEVKVAEMETRLREMIIEVLKPTISRSSRLQHDYEKLCKAFEDHKTELHNLLKGIDELNARGEIIDEFQRRVEQCWSRENAIETKLLSFQREMGEKNEVVDHRLDKLDSDLARLNRNLDLVTEDVEGVGRKAGELKGLLDDGIRENRDKMYEEVKRVDKLLKDQQANLDTLSAEVWGPEDCSEEIAPPSLRRLDKQMRDAGYMLGEAIRDLARLQKLEMEMHNIVKQQTTYEEDLRWSTDLCKSLNTKVDDISVDTKNELRRVSNLMAAFSANLMQEVRASSSLDVKVVKEMREDVDKFVRETQSLLDGLHSTVAANKRQVEAVVREVRTDVESLESKRKKDKQILEEEMCGVRDRVGSVLDSSEGSLKGIEHISNVVSMALQSERMSVALDLQDFLERKHLTQHAPITFQGSEFERPQLLALREKLVYVAQEVLMQGPQQKSIPRKIGTARGIGTGNGRDGIGIGSLGPSPTLQQAAYDQQSAGGDPHRTPSRGGDSRCGSRPGSRAGYMVARPGSRGQPGARGSPPPPDSEEGDNGRSDGGTPGPHNLPPLTGRTMSGGM